MQGERDNIERKAIVLQELLDLTCCEQHSSPTMHKEQDACTFHFLSERADTAHGMVGIQLDALNRHALSCRFVLHEFQKIV